MNVPFPEMDYAMSPTGGDGGKYFDQGTSRTEDGNLSSLLGPVKSLSDCDSRHINFLLNKGFPRGLAIALATSMHDFEHRIWILDNSGSMVIRDGHRIVETSHRTVEGQLVTRWEELQQTVLYHAELAANLGFPTEFMFLNEPGGKFAQEFAVGFDEAGPSQELRTIRNIMTTSSPRGVTNIASAVKKVASSISDKADYLRRSGKRAVVILATDGLPTDENGQESEQIRNDFVSALKRLEGIPIWVVIRLMTDEKKVATFYNSLDAMVDLPLEVLDDLANEAKEVHQYNRWLTYGLPLHRCRELGLSHRLFDLIDERKLSCEEMQCFYALLFGVPLRDIPDARIDFPKFMAFLQNEVTRHPEQWDPIQEKLSPWINLRIMKKVYGKGKCTIM